MSAADTLLEQKHTIAQAITDALYRERPQLMERYGETGRVRCLEDMHYNLEHLAPAVALGEPQLFQRYVIWLRDMLAPRNVPQEDVVRSLELTIDVVQKHLPPDEARAVVDMINAGLQALHS
jgi:hypothetical protein